MNQHKNPFFITIIVVLFISCKANYFPENDHSQRINYVLDDTTHSFYYLKDSDFKVDITRTYFWYHNGQMNASKGKILGKPLDGEYVAYDLEKSPVVTGYFKQGLKSGTWLYHQKGQLSQSTEFLKGVREGENILYADNKMVSKEIYRNDALVEIVDFEDEVMMFTKRFKNGKAEGKWERNLGDSIEVTTYRQGVPIDTVFKSKSTLIPFIKLN